MMCNLTARALNLTACAVNLTARAVNLMARAVNLTARAVNLTARFEVAALPVPSRCAGRTGIHCLAVRAVFKAGFSSAGVVFGRFSGAIGV